LFQRVPSGKLRKAAVFRNDTEDRIGGFPAAETADWATGKSPFQFMGNIAGRIFPRRKAN
jgi:hypothetical protein